MHYSRIARIVVLQAAAEPVLLEHQRAPPRTVGARLCHRLAGVVGAVILGRHELHDVCAGSVGDLPQDIWEHVLDGGLPERYLALLVALGRPPLGQRGELEPLLL